MGCNCGKGKARTKKRPSTLPGKIQKKTVTETVPLPAETSQNVQPQAELKTTTRSVNKKVRNYRQRAASARKVR